MKPAPFFLLKARAEQIPLRENSVSLVIATPPYLGLQRVRQKDCCTHNPQKYRDFLARCLSEATRIVKPGGYILLHTNEPPVRKVRGFLRIVFHVLQKQRRSGRWAPRRVGAETFRTRYRRIEGFRWLGFSIRLYRNLISGHSRPGEIVAHIFSGSGNAAIAALHLSRKPVLLDLHYHRLTKRRLNRRILSRT